MNADNQLYVRLTSRCNLACTFCRAKDAMCASVDDRGTQLSAIEELLNKKEFPFVVWSGGEPLLSFKQLQAARMVIKASGKRVDESLVTNGYHLKAYMFKELNEMNHIEISIDGYSKECSERSLERLLLARNYDLFSFIEQSKTTVITSVITKERLQSYEWHRDLIRMYTCIAPLLPTTFSLSLDENYPGPMTTDEMVNFVMGLDEIEAFLSAEGIKRKARFQLELKRIVNTKCVDCDRYFTVESDGTVTQETSAPDVGVDGCSKLAGAIGAEAYRYLQSWQAAGEARENESRTGSHE